MSGTECRAVVLLSPEYVETYERMESLATKARVESHQKRYRAG